MKNEYYYQIKWSVSRGMNTYGYNIASMWDMETDKKAHSTCGGGYDMLGSLLGAWITANFQEELKAWDDKKIEDHYGVFRGKQRMYCDGACGLSSMERILNTLGYELIRTGLDEKWNKQLWHIKKEPSDKESNK